MRYRQLYCLIFAIIWGVVSATAQGVDNGAQTEITIQVQQAREILRDFVKVNLVASANGPNLSKLAARVTELTDLVKKDVDAHKGITLVIGNRVTNIDNKGAADPAQPLEWKIEQNLILESTEGQKIFELLEATRPGVTIADIIYSVSPDVQIKAETEATTAAMEEFLRRAQLIQVAAKAKRLSLVKLNIVTNLADQTSSGKKEKEVEGNEQITQQPVPTTGSAMGPNTSVLVTQISGSVALHY